MAKNSIIYAINGPVITVKNTDQFFVLEMVYVGNLKLLGEVISINQNFTIIQVYESTTGLGVGEPVLGTGQLLSIPLGPGLITNIYDGIGRPLKDLSKINNSPYLKTGSQAFTLNQEKLWPIKFFVSIQDSVVPGQVIAEIQETKSIKHRLMVPPNVEGKIIFKTENKEIKISDTIIKINTNQGEEISIFGFQTWAIKKARPVYRRLPLSIPLITGQRIIDSLFPIAKGGAAAMPGGFGTGKTMMQHQLAKWSDADLIVYIGCGERGNEMTQALEEFSQIKDPRTGQSLLDRTVLIANTSNMPVAAREASIYTGVTIAEYYRDMGYHVAIMADSTSRWAEALREISGRLEEMPAEEGFPAYLSSRISQFYERAAFVETLNHDHGSVTIIGAVSPQGADFSEPVTQNTKRFVRAFWALDKNLAYARHYPSVNWTLSYSDYNHSLLSWYNQNVDVEFIPTQKKIASLLSEEGKLLEIVKLIGQDVLPDDQKLIIEIGKIIRESFLQQNAYHKEDSYVPLNKQLKMMQVILYLYETLKQLIQNNQPLATVMHDSVFEKINKMKYDISNQDLTPFDDLLTSIDQLASRNKV
ncbi:MAG: V-type ATP synthase subunit A [Bacilli bacterium]